MLIYYYNVIITVHERGREIDHPHLAVTTNLGMTLARALVYSKCGANLHMSPSLDDLANKS
jgi:hypothetical protein